MEREQISLRQHLVEERPLEGGPPGVAPALNRLLQLMWQLKGTSDPARGPYIWYVGHEEYRLLQQMPLSWFHEMVTHQTVMGFRVVLVREEKHLNLAPQRRW